MMKQKDLPGIDIFRAVAIVAVILIHLAASHLDERSILISQIGRFCVPLFVALSGFGLARKYLATSFDFGDFIKRRIWRLLPQYIFWSLIIYAAVNLVFRQDLIMYGRQTIIELLVWGKADYHLYFVPMIVVLYAIFPLLFFISRRFPTLLLGAALLGQSWWYFLIVKHPGGWSDQEQYRFALTWIFYFVLGIYLAIKRLPSWSGFFLAAGVGIGLVLVEQNTIVRLAAHVDPLIATEFTNFPVMSYSTAFILLAIYISTHLTFPNNFVVRFLVRMGKISYIVYLSHTLVLRLWYLFL